MAIDQAENITYGSHNSTNEKYTVFIPGKREPKSGFFQEKSETIKKRLSTG
jgi:hypothetical protein